MRAVLLAVLLAAPLLAGCTSPAPAGRPPPDGEPPAAFQAPAPWWDVGDAYTVRIERPGAAPTTWRMVTFWNDTETQHFWLGVSDRRQAMDMALFSTNPFLGRIHFHILTPHERGMHAAMYNFPLEDGKAWQGFFFDRNWSFVAREGVVQTPAGPERGFHVEGQELLGGGQRIMYTYSPGIRWFTELVETDPGGAEVLRATVEDYAQGASGAFVFLRGRDFYAGPQLGGTHEERFDVREAVDGLGFYVDVRASGPVEIQLIDPAGQLRQRVAGATGSTARFFDEIAPVPQGTWTVRYVATGPLEGRVLATGLIETERSI